MPGGIGPLAPRGGPPGGPKGGPPPGAGEGTGEELLGCPLLLLLEDGGADGGP